jgi:hypothetical protein
MCLADQAKLDMRVGSFTKGGGQKTVLGAPIHGGITIVIININLAPQNE